MKRLFCLTLACLAALPLAAQSSMYNQPVSADTFVSSGDPTLNFGNQGAMEIAASTAAQPRTQISLLQFDTSALLAALNTDYGAGNWTVTGVTLTLFSSVANAGQQPNNSRFNKIAAGGFEFGLLSNNAWSETGITWNMLPGILPGGGGGNTLTPLGTFFWPASGSTSSTWTLNTDPLLINQISNGGLVSILGQPTAGSTVGYLSNARSVNPGYLSITAQAVPEPSTLTLLVGLTGMTCCRRFRRK